MLKDSDGELAEEQLATCLVPLNLKTESVAKQQMCSYHYTRHVDQPFNTGFSLIAQGRVVRPFRGSNHAESVSCHLESLKLVNALWATTPVNPATRMSSNLSGKLVKHAQLSSQLAIVYTKVAQQFHPARNLSFVVKFLVLVLPQTAKILCSSHPSSLGTLRRFLDSKWLPFDSIGQNDHVQPAA